LVLSLHAIHTCSGSFAFEYCSTTISNVWVMGLLRDHASLRKLQLFRNDNSGVDAIVFTSSPETKKGQPKLIDCPWLRFMADSSTYNKTLPNKHLLSVVWFMFKFGQTYPVQ